jgi:hypothetical protein
MGCEPSRLVRRLPASVAGAVWSRYGAGPTPGTRNGLSAVPKFRARRWSVHAESSMAVVRKPRFCLASHITLAATATTENTSGSNWIGHCGFSALQRQALNPNALRIHVTQCPEAVTGNHTPMPHAMESKGSRPGKCSRAEGQTLFCPPSFAN